MTHKGSITIGSSRGSYQGLNESHHGDPMFGRLRGLFKRSKVYTIEEITERVRPVAERYDLEYVCVFG